ncbi:unnamed protein product [Amaranthus hypochondriacus]
MIHPFSPQKSAIKMTLIPSQSSHNQQPLEKLLTNPLLISDKILKLSSKSISFKSYSFTLAQTVNILSNLLRSLLRFSSTSSIYDPPIRHISSRLSLNLRKAYKLVLKTRRRNFLYRLINLVNSADFRRIIILLESSVADLRWVLSILHVDENIQNQNDLVLSLPPIARDDPIIAWVWSFIATIQLGSSLEARIEAAQELNNLALDNDRNKMIIVEECGVPPLLKLLKDGNSSVAQIAAVEVLCSISNDGDRVRVIVENGGAPLIVHLLEDSCMEVKVKISGLVAKMVEFHGGLAIEEFGGENVIKTLVSLLAFETFEYESNLMELKLNCAQSIWRLAKDNLLNCVRINETNGLLGLAKMVENEKGLLKLYCLRAIMEICSIAELNADLRRSVFKTKSPSAMAVIEELLRVIKECDDRIMQIPAIRSIGCLSRTFPARETTRVIPPLVEHLCNADHEVAIEAAIALVKFVDPENFLCLEHSKAIVEFNGFRSVFGLLRMSEEKAQLQGLLLLCYLALNATNSNNEEFGLLGFNQAMVLTALEGVNHSFIAQNPQIGELIVKARYNLSTQSSLRS